LRRKTDAYASGPSEIPREPHELWSCAGSRDGKDGAPDWAKPTIDGRSTHVFKQEGRSRYARC